MMVMNSGEPFPETVGVVLLRWAWRYRSELAPLGVTVGIECAAWWLHVTRPHWWPVILGITTVAAWVLAIFGARFGLAALTGRAYAATTAFAAGKAPNVTTAGLFYGHPKQLLIQGGAALTVIIWDGLVTFLLLRGIGLFMKLRMPDNELIAGDILVHGEVAYPMEEPEAGPDFDEIPGEPEHHHHDKVLADEH